jgi:Alternative complex III, ActD subunit
MAEVHKVYGLGAEFDSAADLLHAAEKVRDSGFKRWDVHTPFPVHGMDAAMGLGKSWLSAPVLAGGIAGLLTAVGLTMIPSFILYPIIVHGKPYNFFSSPAFVPIFFELTVLASAFTSVFSIMAFNRLPQWYHPVFNWERFKRATDDGFFLVIEARDPKFNEIKTRELLESIGGKHVTLIHD